MKDYVVTCNALGDGSVDVPPGRYAGTPDGAGLVLTNMGRTLTAGFLDPPDYELVSGVITVSGGTDGQRVRLFIEV